MASTAAETLHRELAGVAADADTRPADVVGDVADAIGQAPARSLSMKSPISASSGVLFGRRVRPLFLKSPTFPNFFLSTGITCWPLAMKNATCLPMRPNRVSRFGCEPLSRVLAFACSVKPRHLSFFVEASACEASSTPAAADSPDRPAPTARSVPSAPPPTPAAPPPICRRPDPSSLFVELRKISVKLLLTRSNDALFWSVATPADA